MNLFDNYYQEIIENANYHIASYKKGAIAFPIALLLISLLSVWWIKKIGLNNKEKNKYYVIILCIAIIGSIAFISYSLKQIACIRNEIKNKEWIEYSGKVFFDASRNRLELVDNENTIPLFSGKDKNGIMNNNYVNIPTGYSNCYIVYLKKSKVVVLFISLDSFIEN